MAPDEMKNLGYAEEQKVAASTGAAAAAGAVNAAASGSDPGRK